MKKYKLNKEEEEILDAIENGEWELVGLKQAALDHYAVIAKNTLRKNKRLNIRLSEADINNIKVKAAEEGMPYQTLIASIIHKYATGRLKKT